MPRSNAMTLPLRMEEASQPGEARRLAVSLADDLGFDDPLRGQVALVVTEVATNLVKHARGGELLMRAIDGPAPGLEVLALDRGPGMDDFARCLADGYSTAGSPGTGLGAIARLARLLDVHSAPGLGTALLVQMGPPLKDPAIDLGAVNLPYPGEAECGDSWVVREHDGLVSLMVVDGLGHGPLAADAAAEAVRAFHDHAPRGPAGAIEAIHPFLKGTRGAALAIAALDPAREQIRYAGVGNIAGVILDPGGERPKSLISHNGIVGHELRKAQEFAYPWPGGAMLVMNSDGLATHWRPDRYPGLAARHPALVAGLLYRDHRRGRDDVTVLAARAGGTGPG